MPEGAFIIIYVVFSLLTAFCCSQRRVGFFGGFVLSLLITPVLMILVLILLAPHRRVEPQRPPELK
jgi:ABC-type multidrug transport system permease subunit